MASKRRLSEEKVRVKGPFQREPLYESWTQHRTHTRCRLGTPTHPGPGWNKGRGRSCCHLLMLRGRWAWGESRELPEKAARPTCAHSSKGPEAQLLPTSAQLPGRNLSFPHAEAQPPRTPPSLQLIPVQGFFHLEGWLLTPLWPELGAPLWSVAPLGWGLLAGASRPFLQRQVPWPGLLLVFQALFSCSVGQYIIREHFQALHAERNLPTSSQKVGRKPTGFPTTLVSSTPGHPPVPWLRPAVPHSPPGLPPPPTPTALHKPESSLQTWQGRNVSWKELRLPSGTK